MPRVKIDYVVSFSSEDKEHPANNILSWEVNKKKWLCAKGEPSCSIVLQLTKAVKINNVNIGAYHAALVEVLVGLSEKPNDPYQVLVPSSTFLSPMDSRRGEGIERVRSFSADQLFGETKDKKWDRIRVVCSQPYNKHCKYGLSFIQFYEPETGVEPKQESPKPQASAVPDRMLNFNVDTFSSDEEEFKPGELFASHKIEKEKAGNTEAQIRQATSHMLKNIPDSSASLTKTPITKPTNKRKYSDNMATPNQTDRQRNSLMYTDDDEKPNAKIDRIVNRHRDEKGKKDAERRQMEEKVKQKKVQDHNSQDTPDSKKKTFDTVIPKKESDSSNNHRNRNSSEDETVVTLKTEIDIEPEEIYDHRKRKLSPDKDTNTVRVKEEKDRDVDASSSKDDRKKPRSSTTISTSNEGKNNQEDNEFVTLCKQLESNEELYYINFRMSKDSFEQLYVTLRDILIIDSNWKAIDSKKKLFICLRYMTTGDSYKKIAKAFGVGCTTVGNVIRNMSRLIWEVLQPQYMPCPNMEMWRLSEKGYSETWGFPNCIGGIISRHVTIKTTNSERNGTENFNKKNPYTIVFTAITDPYHRIIVMDVGCYGLIKETNLFESTSCYSRFAHGEAEVPPPKRLPNSDVILPHVLIGDECFSLEPFLMRPFPKRAVIKDEKKELFNKHLDRAKTVVDTTFNILLERWKIFHRPMETAEDTACYVIKAICCLHNYIIMKDGVLRTVEEASEKPKLTTKAVFPIKPTNHRSARKCYKIRDQFLDYFYSKRIL